MAVSDSTKHFLNSSAGKELKEYLTARLLELRDIENVIDIATPTNQAIELRAQKRAYRKLREILSDIMTLCAETKTKDPRDSYAM